MLIKVYGADPRRVDADLEALSQGLISFEPLGLDEALKAVQYSAVDGVDITDAALLTICLRSGHRVLCTDDRRLAVAAATAGLVVENPIDNALRRLISEWEAQELSPRGLPRILWRTHQWLQARDEAEADAFRSATGSFVHLP